MLAALQFAVDALLRQIRLSPREALTELSSVQHELLAHLVAFLQLPHHLVIRLYLEVHVLGERFVLPRRRELDRREEGNAGTRRCIRGVSKHCEHSTSHTRDGVLRVSLASGAHSTSPVHTCRCAGDRIE